MSVWNVIHKNFHTNIADWLKFERTLQTSCEFRAACQSCVKQSTSLSLKDSNERVYGTNTLHFPNNTKAKGVKNISNFTSPSLSLKMQ